MDAIQYYSLYVTLVFAVACRELLTPQQHYDWGLRALKTVLKGCGSLLKTKKKIASDGGGESTRIDL